MSFLLKRIEKTEKGKKTTRYRVFGFIEVIILLAIVITSVNITYLTVPIFLTVVFLLIQIAKIVKAHTDKTLQTEIKENG